MKSNKGFSLVELIIVIAIMAILAAAIAPALIRYINKARIADDLTAAGEIVSAANTAMTNEDANDEIMKAASGGNLAAIATIDANGVSASSYKSFEAEMKATLPNGAKKKYVKDSTDGYILELSKDQFVVYAAQGSTKKDMLNPKAAGEYAK